MNETLFESCSASFEAAEPEAQQTGISIRHDFVPLRAILEHTIRRDVFRAAVRRMRQNPDILLSPDCLNPSILDRFISNLLAVRIDGLPGGKIDFPRDFSETPYRRLMLLEATARELGSRWKSSKADFFDVTLACAKLQALTKRIQEDLGTLPVDPDAPCLLVTAVPGEQHTLMQNLVELMFRSRGWDTIYYANLSGSDIRAVLEQRQVDLVCLSWSSDNLYPGLESVMSGVNEIETKQRPPVMLGGPAAERLVEKATGLGVDCIIDNAYQAISIAERYISLRRSLTLRQRPTKLSDALSAAIP
jgi:methanogenic corrinoid protein MtbC1